jgi:hypothetical protein
VATADLPEASSIFGCTRLRTFAEAAGQAYDAAWRWGYNTRFGQDNSDFYQRQVHYDDAEAYLLARIRIDLSIPED